jgi:hypothetical protein
MPTLSPDGRYMARLSSTEDLQIIRLPSRSEAAEKNQAILRYLQTE